MGNELSVNLGRLKGFPLCLGQGLVPLPESLGTAGLTLAMSSAAICGAVPGRSSLFRFPT